MKKQPATKEAYIITAVCGYLAAVGVPYWRINSGAYKTERGGFVRYGAPGMADVYAVGPAGRSIWIECKRPEGGRLSAAQAEFLEVINKAGGVGIVVNSIDSLETQLKERGVI